MEVGDQLVDLETGCCCCRNVVIESLPFSLEEPRVSPSISVVWEEVEERGSTASGTVVENEVPIPVMVCVQ